MVAKELAKNKTYEIDSSLDVIEIEHVLKLLDISFLEGQISTDPSVERCNIHKGRLKKLIDQL